MGEQIDYGPNQGHEFLYGGIVNRKVKRFMMGFFGTFAFAAFIAAILWLIKMMELYIPLPFRLWLVGLLIASGVGLIMATEFVLENNDRTN